MFEYWILKTKYFASTRETCNTTLRSRVLVSKPRASDLLSPQPTHTKKSSWIGNKKHTKCRTTWRLKLAQVFSEVKLVSFFPFVINLLLFIHFFSFHRLCLCSGIKHPTIQAISYTTLLFGRCKPVLSSPLMDLKKLCSKNIVHTTIQQCWYDSPRRRIY